MDFTDLTQGIVRGSILGGKKPLGMWRPLGLYNRKEELDRIAGCILEDVMCWVAHANQIFIVSLADPATGHGDSEEGWT